MIDAGEFLIHHTTRSNIEVPHLGIPHLAFGQPDLGLRGMDEGMRILVPQLIPIRLAGLGDCVVIALRTTAKSVEDNEENRRGFHEKVYLT